MMPHDLPAWAARSINKASGGSKLEYLRQASMNCEQYCDWQQDEQQNQQQPFSTLEHCNQHLKVVNGLSYDGGKRRKGSKVHIAVDTFGHLLGLYVTSASEQDRAKSATVGATGAANYRRVSISGVCRPRLYG